MGISRVAVATLLVNAVQNTAMHDTRNTIAVGGSASNFVRNVAIASDNPEAYNMAQTITILEHTNDNCFQLNSYDT